MSKFIKVFNGTNYIHLSIDKIYFIEEYSNQSEYYSKYNTKISFDETGCQNILLTDHIEDVLLKLK